MIKKYKYTVEAESTVHTFGYVDHNYGDYTIKDVAEAAAKDFFDNHTSHECDFPLCFTIIDNESGIEISKHSVELYYAPYFSEVKP